VLFKCLLPIAYCIISTVFPPLECDATPTVFWRTFKFLAIYLLLIFCRQYAVTMSQRILFFTSMIQQTALVFSTKRFSFFSFGDVLIPRFVTVFIYLLVFTFALEIALTNSKITGVSKEKFSQISFYILKHALHQKWTEILFRFNNENNIKSTSTNSYFTHFRSIKNITVHCVPCVCFICFSTISCYKTIIISTLLSLNKQ